MSIDIYKSGSKYESFIRQAYDIQINEEHGAFGQYMVNLINLENGEKETPYVTHSGQLADIKNYMSKALLAALKRKFSVPVKQLLYTQLDKVSFATISQQLLEVCEDCLFQFSNNIP